MDYPGDFLKLRSGPSPSGQAHKRGHDRIDAPYLTSKAQGVGGLVTTKKQQDFSQSWLEAGEPSLIGYYKLNDTSIYPVLIDIEDDESRRIASLTPFYTLGTAAANPTLARLPYVGDGFVLALFSNINDIGADTDAVTHWPVLAKATRWPQYLASDAARMGNTTTFIDDIQITGLLTDLHAFCLTCSGWDGSTKRYRFGLAATYWSGTPHVDNRVPIFYAGDTGTQTMTQKAPVYYSGRNNLTFVPFVTGLGKLQALQVVEEDETLVLPKVAPYFAESANHGDTWSSVAAAFLAPYLFEYPASGPDRAYYENLQLAGLAFSSVIIYLGQGKKLLIIPNGYKDMLGSGGTPANARFGPKAFLDSGGGYVNIAWPPDDWFTSSNGSSLGGDYLRFFGYTNDLKSCHFAFGEGCMYMPVRRNGTENRLMFTRDFGSTWQFTEPLPGLMNTNSLTNFGTVIRPYVDSSNKGLIVFAVPNYDIDRIDIMATDGDFAAFRKVGSFKPGGTSGLDPASDPTFQVFFSYFGGDNKPYVFPAFPGEFDQP